MQVIFSDRAYASVMAETTEKIETETGGLFLGTVEGETWYIVEAIDPGPNSVFEVAYFEYDKKYTQHLINKIANLYSEKLSLIGLWHRHPGSFDVFSTTDNGTNAKYAAMRSCGAISGLVNIDPTFRFTMYHVARPCKYTKIKYLVGDNLIPKKYLTLKSTEEFERIMDNILHPNSSDDELVPSVSLRSFLDKILPALESRKYSIAVARPDANDENTKDELINTIVSDLTFMSDEIGIQMSVLQRSGLIAIVQEAVDETVQAFFAFDAKERVTVFQYQKQNYLYEEGLFERLFRDGNTNHFEETRPRITVSRSEAGTPQEGLRTIMEDFFGLFGFHLNGDE